jgi:hypothetical protein
VINIVPPGEGSLIVSIVPGLICAGEAAWGCTGLVYDEKGKYVSGTMQFSSLETIRNEEIVAHEFMWALGLRTTLNNPTPGLTSPNHLGSWGYPYPNEEELKVLIGRYSYPYLAAYSAGP